MFAWLKKLFGSEKAPEHVLGEHAARAIAADERRKAKGNLGKSPMPALQYEDDELGLHRPRQTSLDSELAGLTRKFAKADEHTRAAMRSSISVDEFGTLMAFSRRSAVFALRERSLDQVTDGLTALAMIEAERVDGRDILDALSLLNHAAERLGADANRHLRGAGRLAEPAVVELIDGFIGQWRGKPLRSLSGYEEVEIDGQAGFVRWGCRVYHPTRDLTTAAIEIADLIAKDNYVIDSVEIATEFPSVWLQPKDNDALGQVMKAVRACARVSAHLRPGEHLNSFMQMQMFVVFLVETADESAARTLLRIAQQKKPADRAMLAVAEKDLFWLVVAGPCAVGAESFETTDKLRRFSDGLTGILRRHTRASSPAADGPSS
jgi:hypothetical protein